METKKEFIKFDYCYCKALLDAQKVDDAKKYIKRFFFRYRTEVFFYTGSTFLLYPRAKAIELLPEDLQIEYMVPNEVTKKFDKVNVKLSKYLKETDFMKDEYTPTIDFSKDMIFTEKKVRQGFEFEEKFINMAKPLGIDISAKSKRTKEATANIQLIYSHIKEVLCSNNEEVNQYFLNWIACTFGGRKLRKAIYIQSTERTGKGIIFNNLLKAILGDRMYKTNSIEEITKYTKAFEGCSLVQPDELPHYDDQKGLQDSLKGLITEPDFICRSMWESGYSQKNTFNMLFTTNNNAIMLTEHNKERYVLLDVSEIRLGQLDYFAKLAAILKDPNILLMFYEDMIDRFKTLKNWNEDVVPMTETKKRKIIEALPLIYKYLKENYILTKTNLNMRTDLFLAEYRNSTKDKSSSQRLGGYLSKLGITAHKNSKNNGYNYKMTCEDMTKVFNEKNWMDDTVDFVNVDGPEDIKNDIAFEEEKQKIIDAKNKEIEDLKRIIEDLKNPKPLVVEVKHETPIEVALDPQVLQDIETLDDINNLSVVIKAKQKQAKKEAIQKEAKLKPEAKQETIKKQKSKPEKEAKKSRKPPSYDNNTPNSKELDDLLGIL